MVKRIAWNKGLTKKTDNRILKQANLLKGHFVSKETKLKIKKTLESKCPIGAIICNKCKNIYRNFIKISQFSKDEKCNYQLYARYLVERHLNKKLKINEVVHHINRITTDDRIENLQLMTIQEHTSLHKKGQKLTNNHKKNISRSMLKGGITKNG